MSGLKKRKETQHRNSSTTRQSARVFIKNSLIILVGSVRHLCYPQAIGDSSGGLDLFLHFCAPACRSCSDGPGTIQGLGNYPPCVSDASQIRHTLGTLDYR